MIERYPHQIEELELAKKMPNRGLIWDVGTGKTLGIIDILEHHYSQFGQMFNTLIISPSVTLYNWKKEIQKYTKISARDIVILEGSGKKRAEQLEVINTKFGTIVITNYEALLNDQVLTLLKSFRARVVVADESHYIKNGKAERTKRTIMLGDLASHRYILSGTMILNSILDIFSQFRFLDKGETFGKNFFVFRATYMYDQNAGMPKFSHFPNFVPRKEMFSTLNEKIFKLCSKVDKDKCLKLPPLIITERIVVMEGEQKKAYEEMKKSFITFVKGKDENTLAAVATIALVKVNKMIQIVNGHVKTETGETVLFKGNKKREALKELLTELTPANKVIVWCVFEADYKIISEVCSEVGINHVFLTGKMDTKEKAEAIDSFCTGSASVLIGNRRAGVGINLIEAGYSIVYSRNFSLGEEIQSEGRNYRGGSEMHEKIIKIVLQAKDSVDTVISKSLESKEDLSNNILAIAAQLEGEDV